MQVRASEIIERVLGRPRRPYSRHEMSVSGRHFASWLWRGQLATRWKVWCIVIDDGSVTGQLGLQPVQGQGSAIQTKQISQPSLYGSPTLGTPTTASASTHGRRVAEDRNEPDMLPTQRRSSRLGVTRPRVGSLLLMNLFFD